MDAAVTRGGERSFDSAGQRIYTIFSWVVLAMSWLGVLDRLLMPAEQLYAVLGLMLLVLPLVAAGLGVGDSRAERIFGAQVGLVMFLLYGFMPRPQLSLWVAVVVTFGWSGALTATTFKVMWRVLP